MKAVVIGGCGHIGTYLVPRLVKAGYQVINVTRGRANLTCRIMPGMKWSRLSWIGRKRTKMVLWKENRGDERGCGD